MQIARPNQKDWQKLHLSSWESRGWVTFTCKYSNQPHFIASVRKKLTARLTKNTVQANSIIVFSPIRKKITRQSLR